MTMVLLADISNSTRNALTFTGWAIILTSVALVVFTYRRRSSDLICAWHWLLLGCATNIGVGSLEALDRTKLIFEEYTSFQFFNADYMESVRRNIFFFVSLLIIYYGLKTFRKFGHKRFIVSPVWSNAMLANVLFICAAFMLTVTVVSVPFFKEVIFNLAQKAAIFSATFAFIAWYRNRSSPITLVLFLAVLAISGLFCIKVSAGRRLLITLIAAPVVASYWLKWRYSRPAKVLTLSGIGAVIVVMGGLSYQLIRRFDTHGGGPQQERSYSNIMQSLKSINMEGIEAQLDEWKRLLAQNNFEYGLLTKRIVENGTAKVHPVNTLQFLACYGIPRSAWAEKPRTIGYRLPREYLAMPFRTVWGVGIAGQSYYEGGYLVLILYAGVLVLVVRMIDEPLLREPNNPFFIATLAGASAYLVNTMRGDLGTNLAEVLECFLFALILNWTSRLWGRSQPNAYQNTPPPVRGPYG